MKKISVAFIACNKNPTKYLNDPSFIYRCQNLAQGLHQIGHKTALLHYTQIDLRTQYDILVFHRPTYKFLMQFKLWMLKLNASKLIADFDDYIFDPKSASSSPGVLNGLVSLKQTKKNFSANKKALLLFDHITVSTTPLQQKISSLMPEANVLLLTNCVHWSWRDLPEFNKPEKLITYFPGTKSHDRDFALINRPLEQFLNEHPEVKLSVTGVLNFSIKCSPQQLITHDKQQFMDYATHVARSWLNLAPLENTEFNKHKSALKVIEAAYWNSPTIATPIPDVVRLIGAGAFTAQTEDDWYRQLNAMVNEDYYAAAAAGLRQKILQQSCITTNSQKLIEWLL